MKKQFVVFVLFLMLAVPCFAQGGMKLAVLEPEGIGLSEDERWMLSLIQSSITADFNKYSKITVIDRQNLENIIAEQKRSLEAATSDEEGDAIRIGNLANATHVLSGKITKTPNAFMLELAVTDVESGVRRASYSPSPVTPKAVENLSALKEASADLLKQLGVNLTASQLTELKGPIAEEKIQAQTALAHGVVAQRQGTSVAALSYYYQAASFDPSLLEAVNRSSVMSANISGANLGENIRNDIVWRRGWVERLKETEETFHKIISNANPPYTLFYSTGIETKDINYKTETANLSTPINLTANLEWFNAMKQALKAAQAVLDGLNATERKKDWELANWPVRGVSSTNPFTSSYSSSKQYDLSVEFELVNQEGKVIGRQVAKLRPSFSIGIGNNSQFAVNFTGNTSSTLTFNSVKADDITDNLTIRPASVNGASPEAAGFSITAISAEKRAEDLVFRIEKGVVMGFSKSLSDSEKAKHRDLVIPSEAWGQPVTAIGAKAFENCGITSVTIPSTITSIGEGAFARNKLTKVTIPNSVNTIGAKAFAYSYTTKYSQGQQVIDREFNPITEITIGENVRIDSSAFSYGYHIFGQSYQENGSKAGTYIYGYYWNGYGWKKKAVSDEEKEGEKKEEESSWHLSPSVGVGILYMVNDIDSLYSSLGFMFFGNIELFKPKVDFFRFGFNVGFGGGSNDMDAVRKIHPDIDKKVSGPNFFNVGAFARLYPASFMYLSGGASYGYYGSYGGYPQDTTKSGDVISGPSTHTVVFPVGAGFVLGRPSKYKGLVLEALYNIAMLKNGIGGYWSFNLGYKFGRYRIGN